MWSQCGLSWVWPVSFWLRFVFLESAEMLVPWVKLDWSCENVVIEDEISIWLSVEISAVVISMVAITVFLVYCMTVVSVDVDVVPVCNGGFIDAKSEEWLLVIVVEYLIETVLTTSDEVKFGVLKVCKSSLVLVRVKTVDTPVEKVFEVNDKGLGFDWIFSVNASSVEVVLGNFPIILTATGLANWKIFVASTDVLSRVKKL